jgi:hypothetical protein
MSLRRRLLASCLAAAAALSGGIAGAQTGSDPAPAASASAPTIDLADALALIDVLLSPELLAAAGVDAGGQALRDAALDATLPVYPRIRAVHGLAYYYNPETSAFLAALARDLEAPEPLRVAAVVVAASDPQPAAWSGVDALLGALALDSSADVRGAVERGRQRVAGVRGAWREGN